MTDSPPDSTLLNLEPAVEVFRSDVLAGLRERPRRLPCKYFYDERGSELFEQICELDEYYLTRTELSIMQRYAREMAEQIGPGVMLVEYGSGSGAKTRILLDHLDSPSSYVPVDISFEHLKQTTADLAKSYPQIEMLPVCADFTATFQLPESKQTTTHAAVYFPGSTIGNFEPDSACRFLARITPLCGRGGGLLIGIDLQKETAIIEAAYNDAKGVTARFNLNLLRRINHELDGDFDLDEFAHRASYNGQLGRIEMSLVSRCDQSVTIGAETFEFAKGDAVCTEYSYKYNVDDFAAMAANVGLALHRCWTDEQDRFAVLHFVVRD